MARERSKTDESHDRYEVTASAGKLAFMSTLASWMKRTRTSQRGLADMIGYSPTAISQFLANPGGIPEKFIRAVATSIPDLSSEYVRFRLTADAPFFTASETKQSIEQRLGLVKGRVSMLDAIDLMQAAVDGAIDELKRHV